MDFDSNCTPELIRGVADEGSMSEQYWTLLKAADRISALEAQLAQYRWRRVEEEMPDPLTEVLVWRKGCFDPWVGYWGGVTVDTWYEDKGGAVYMPSHWMPLPPAPEEGE